MMFAVYHTITIFLVILMLIVLIMVVLFMTLLMVAGDMICLNHTLNRLINLFCRKRLLCFYRILHGRIILHRSITFFLPQPGE